MSLLLIDSCRSNPATTAGGAKWDFFWASTMLNTIDGRVCYQLAADGDAFYKDLGADEDSTIIVGGRFRVSSLDTDVNDRMFELAGDGGATVHIQLAMDSAGEFNLYRGDHGTLLTSSANNAYPANDWFYVEMKAVIADAGGSVVVRVNGVEVINFSGDTRNGGADALIDRVIWGQSETIVTYYGTDCVIMNGQGSDFNDFIGPALILAKVPTGAGNYTEWTPNAGANWAAVDEGVGGSPDDDTTYVESTSAGDRDSYVVEDVTEVSTILAVQASAQSRFDAGALDIATFLRRSATDDDGTAETPSGSYTARGLTIWETDPIAAGAWTVANFDSTEFGLVSS